MTTMLQPVANHKLESRPELRVVYFDHTAVLSGGELALLETIRHLDRSLIEPIVLLGEHGPLEQALAGEATTCVLELDPEVRETRKDTLTGIRFTHARRMLRSVPYIRKLVKFLRDVNPDVLHTNSLKSDLLGGIAARWVGIPVVWHVRDRISPDYLPATAVFIFRLAARWIPNFIVGCSASVIETLHLPASKPSAVAYSGIDLRDYESASSGSTAQSHGSDDPSNLIMIGLVGRLGPWKGQHIFIEAAAKVHRDFPQTRFLLYGSAMFGEKDYVESLHRQVRDLSLEGAVEFRGFERNIAAAILNLDILVHASVSPEPFGQVIAQGMAAAKPVIASQGGGASEIIRHGVDGMLVKRGDPEALAEALSVLLRDPCLAQRLALQGRERVRSKFTIQQTVQIMTDVFREMVKRARSKDRLRRRSVLTERAITPRKSIPASTE